MALPAVGSALAGYSSVSLLDNVVCMACSLSFPKDRASLVGYLKAVLASAAGLWALLWVHVFKSGPGLLAYIAFTACVSGGGGFDHFSFTFTASQLRPFLRAVVALEEISDLKSQVFIYFPAMICKL